MAKPGVGALYGILYLDALYVKMRHEGRWKIARCT